MKRFPWLFFIMLMWIVTGNALDTADNTNISSKWLDKANWVTYENPTYGFIIRYPNDLRIEKTFHGHYLASDNWRVEFDRDAGIGKPLLSIPIVKVGINKPGLYYAVELRIGVSHDPIALKNCFVGTDTTAEINGITFHVMKFSDQAMMQYLNGVSYRVIHKDQCFAIEQLKTGSEPQDETQAKELKQLMSIENSYPSLTNIMKTFEFTD
ncbi:MAG TPA: hypothetical protein VHE99_07605 [Gammaproteobacteria bacterium]|nr:hypothetical protein [Gammaproteobacteria bacterium]